ncbi:MAG: hypothetical protein DRJ64_06625 [Thermoprotei archaeon]|nr:MAG: hypothetical protein DRJ64_06625 [Thermoprotei archaeon]
MKGYDFDVIKSQYNLRDEVAAVLGQPKKHTGKYDQYACPINEESTPDGAFTVYDDRYYCFSCGEFGDVLDFFAFVKGVELKAILSEHQIKMTPDELVRHREKIAGAKLIVKQKADADYRTALEKLHAARKWKVYHDNLTQHTRGIWRSRGIPDVWQDIWELGFSKNFRYGIKGGVATSDTISIPIKSNKGKVLTIRHRLLNALDGQRYRPDQEGLGAFPFLCNTDMEKAENLIIVEGEIKSQNVFIKYDDINFQVVGVPSKSMMNDVVRGAKGRNLFVIPDPDALRLKAKYKDTAHKDRAIKTIAETREALKFAGARVFVPPIKIDDWILSEEMSTREFRMILNQARVA